MRKKKESSKISFKKILIILLCLISIILLIGFTISRFQSDAEVIAKMDTAFYVVKEEYQEMNLKLDSIVPRDEPYEYNFTIANTNGTNRAEVNLEYDLVIVTTTNLPLNYELYINGDNSTNIITEQVTEKDEDGTYFKTIRTNKEEFGFTEDEVNTYKLVIYFPSIYKDIKYQDVIEGIEIQVNSRQIISE